ncbi:hypothetical protein BCR34DRAFT_623348 [Clohesyomyces aquaticus]|uniref:Homeobox domain-containing protein n=1 Tax=Clohesyomyces aquaticus TaxID=1231657 RepID=A0A1Y1ZW12_9PLEO|nr:hypothetical protein BCR34DRAFT_623348 [Clohesyomyces aquaticus]
MADLPLPHSSSPAPARSFAATPAGSSSPNSCFLVHSVRTLAANLPPDIDNKPLARQKRRRTSKDDEEVLKAEYLKNPKPDKAARMEIVSKVALGEKEVQIWFQNKRQNDRRRSRPLDSSSSHLHLPSSSSNMSDSPTDEDVHVNEVDDEAAEVSAQASPTAEAREQPDSTQGATKDHESNDLELTPAKSDAQNTDSQDTVESSTIPSTDPQTIETLPSEISNSQQSLSSSQGASQSNTSSWISNRRSASSMRPHEDLDTTTKPEATANTRSLKRAHSFVRLSLTADGGARVVTDADQSPSPPKQKSDPATFARAAAGLRRSYSAAGLNQRIAAASRGEPLPKMARTSTDVGWSRDSRAWEFWCDPDSRHRGSLTTRAEQEVSGSAADAIGLIRSNRRVLGQNQSRQNTPVLSRAGSTKALGEHGVKKSRVPMQRASTISGRLQTKGSKNRKEDGSSSDELPQTESDKENWEPDAPVPHSRRPPPNASQHARQILGENTDVMSQSSSLGAMLAREKGKNTGGLTRENTDPEQDDELRSFMNSDGLSAKTSLSSAEEAGCVEGLLKLSQGNWR